MTKVQTTLKLSRSLTDRELESLARIHSVYGIFAARLQPSGTDLFIEYDASRLSLKEVRGTLQQNGLPIN